MNKQVDCFVMSQAKAAPVCRRPSAMFSVVSAVLGIMLAGCVTAGEKVSTPQQKSDVPTFGAGTAKELAFSDMRVTLVFAVDEDGKVQEFRAPGTKTFTVRDLAAHPLKAGSIAAFEAFSIIKTTNPKICWPTIGGTLKCVEW